MNSCLYFGTVRHRRFAPKKHSFTYQIFQLYLDLDEVPDVFDGRLLWSARGPCVAKRSGRRDSMWMDPSEC